MVVPLSTIKSGGVVLEAFSRLLFHVILSTPIW